MPWESYQWQFEQAIEGRGILAFDDGWHKFSVARWLFGPVDEVMAWVGRTEVIPGVVIEDAPWGDCGRVLVSGMTGRRDRSGRLPLPRVGQHCVLKAGLRED